MNPFVILVSSWFISFFERPDRHHADRTSVIVGWVNTHPTMKPRFDWPGFGPLLERTCFRPSVPTPYTP